MIRSYAGLSWGLNARQKEGGEPDWNPGLAHEGNIKGNGNGGYGKNRKCGTQRKSIQMII